MLKKRRWKYLGNRSGKEKMAREEAENAECKIAV